MDAQQPRRLREVAAAVGEHALDVFPFHPRQRRNPRGVLAGAQRAFTAERRENLIGVDRFGQIRCSKLQALTAVAMLP